MRGEAKLGPVSIDATYADRQNTIYGNEGGPREGYDGKFWLLTGGIKTGPVTTRGFAYLLDYDPTSFTFQTNSSQTYGFRSTGSLKILPKLKLNFAGSFARQSNYRDNPTRFAASYAGVAYRFTRIKAVPGLNAQVTYHQYGSDIGSLRYGYETDAAIGFKTGPVRWLAKYADYVARGFGVTTKKFWLKAEYGF